MSEKPSKEELMEQLKSLGLQYQEHRKKFPNAAANLHPAPPPITLEAALEAPNAVAEISKRISGPYASMTEPERMFWKAHYLMGDTFNGGFIQTFDNSTGDHFSDVELFVNEYCSEPLRQIFRELKQIFPDGNVPADHEQREKALEQIKESKGDDPFDALDGRFYDLETEFCDGLLSLAKKHRESFRGLK